VSGDGAGDKPPEPILRRILAAPVRAVRAQRYARVGNPVARERARADLALEPTLRDAIEAIRTRWPEAQNQTDSAPVFIISSGWRVGSTLLQRLVMSSERLIMWGEPYSREALLAHLAEPIKGIGLGMSSKHQFTEGDVDAGEASRKWVATMGPTVMQVLKGQIAYLEVLLGDPAREAGYDRWGLKEVRLTMDHAYWLRWLFPKAVFLFIYRNPYDAYVSFRGLYFHERWPDKPVYTPAQFGAHWRRTAEGIVSEFDRVGGLLIKYEDLVSGAFSLDALEAHIGMPVARDLLRKKVGSSGHDLSAIPRVEFEMLRRAVDPVAKRLGYEGPTRQGP